MKAEEKTGWLFKFIDPPAVLPWMAGAAVVSFPCFYILEELPVWAGFLFLFLLIFPAVEDALTGYIADGWCLSIGGSGGMYALLSGNVRELWGAAGVFVFLLGLYLLKKDAMGEGDIWLGTAIALWLPGWSAILFLWLTFLLGGITGMFSLLRKKKRWTEGLAFGPFLCISGALVFIFGEKLVGWYASFF